MRSEQGLLAQRPILIRAFIAAGAVEVTAALILNTLPSIVGALTDAGRLDPAMAGYVVAIDLAAQVAGTLLFMRESRRRLWSTCFSAGLALMVIGNLLSCATLTVGGLIATRVIAGIGAGILRSAYYVLLARARDPARAVAILCVAQILSSAGAFAVFPLLIGAAGWYGPYLAVSGLGIVMFATAPWWPKQLGGSRGTPMSLAFGSTAAVALVATLVNFAAMEGAWGFMEAIGKGLGESKAAIGTALTLAAIPGILAMMLVPVISARISVARALMLGLCLTLVSFYMLTIETRCWPFGMSLGLFYFVWNLTIPFQFAAVAASDPSGAAAAAFPAADGLGIAAGPAVAGVVVLQYGTPSLLVVAAGCAAISVAMFVAASRRRG